MSVRVNLLPRATKEGARSTQQRVIAGVVVLLLLFALAGASLWQRGTLRTAEDELADARAELSAAQADVASLAAYTELETRLADSEALITSTLGGEMSLAAVLQDFALIMPSEAAINSLSIGVAPVEAEDGTIIAVGTVSATMEVEASHAPGVERVLRQFDHVAGFRDVYPGGSTIDEDDIADFNLTLQLGPEYLTRRYLNGLLEVAP